MVFVAGSEGCKYTDSIQKIKRPVRYYDKKTEGSFYKLLAIHEFTLEISTIIAYGVTLAAVFFGATGLPQALIGGLFGRAVDPMLGLLIGGLLTWGGVDLAWFYLEGDHIPISALILSVALIFLHGFISEERLTQQSRVVMAGEAWAVIIVGLALFFLQDSVRSY